MTQVIMQVTIETAMVVVQALAVASAEAGIGSSNEAAGMGPKLCRPSLKQPFFDWSATDKYAELTIFRMEESKIFKHMI